MNGGLLSIRGLVKEFGALVAVNDLDLDIAPGEIHALIGPNGAGKTTLVNLVAGEILPDGGRIFFKGEEISRLPVHKRSRMGIGRTFQITSILNGFSVLDNVSLAVQAKTGHSFHFWKNARKIRALRHPAMEILEMTGLADRADTPAKWLSHGEQRQVGIAMALATGPELLILDEPMAGMGPRACSSLMELLNKLKYHCTLFLIEHDMDAVFTLADRISVLDYGELIATGSTENIRKNPDVLNAYLGEEG